MASTHVNVWVHVIFSTKDRQPLFGPRLRPKICAYLAGIAQNLGARVSCINGVEDHVHIPTSLPGTIGGVHGEWPGQYFAWQSGYSAFSVSRSNLDDVRRYVEQQEEHHKRMSFQGEFLAFMKKHEVGYDERYIWG